MNASRRSCTRGLLLLSLCALGCASPTGYHPLTGAGGWEDTRLQPDFFRVSFEGNESTTMTRAQDLALLRASDLTLANGYTHFAVVDESESTRIDQVVTPASTETEETTSGHGQIGRAHV